MSSSSAQVMEQKQRAKPLPNEVPGSPKIIKRRRGNGNAHKTEPGARVTSSLHRRRWVGGCTVAKRANAGTKNPPQSISTKFHAHETKYTTTCGLPTLLGEQKYKIGGAFVPFSDQSVTLQPLKRRSHVLGSVVRSPFGSHNQKVTKLVLK